MWSFLLLLLPLLTGYEAVSEVRGCPEGWVEFTCKCPGTCDSIVLDDPRGKPKKNTQRDVWETKGSISLYHDTKNKKLKVAIKQLQREDFGQYRCKFYQEPKSLNDTVELRLVNDRDGCQGQFIQIAYRTAKTTITCDYQGNKYESGVMFFCKENTKSICEDILTTKSSPKSKKTFTLTENNSSLSMSISDVSSHHDGVYWCGVKLNDGSYRTTLRKIQLEVKNIMKFTKSPKVGQNLTYWCGYLEGAPINKFICKGEDPSSCQRQVSTAQQNMTTGKFMMKEDRVKRNITITVKEVTADDAGMYWCGAESTDNKHSNPFYHRFKMTVVPRPPPTSAVSSTVTTSTSAKSDVPLPTTSPVSSTITTPTSAEINGVPHVVIIVIVCVAVLLLLLLVLILSRVYKRFSHSKNTRNGTAAQQIREDYVYEEIQEHVQRPDSGNAVNTIYATANFPTNPSASLHYSTIKFQNSSDKAGGEALILRPSSSPCEYSTVKKSQGPTYSTVNDPSTSPHDPLYSTINKPQ